MYNNAYYVLDLYKEWWCATIADYVMEMFFLNIQCFILFSKKMLAVVSCPLVWILNNMDIKSISFISIQGCYHNSSRFALDCCSFFFVKATRVRHCFIFFFKWLDSNVEDKLLYLYTRFSLSSFEIFALHSLPHYCNIYIYIYIRIDTNQWHQISLYMYI